jgi:putative alpha-1,2-mannosidase
MKKTLLLILVICCSFFELTGIGVNPASYVNPFIGTFGDARTHPGAMCPFGMVSVSPINTYNPDNFETGHFSYHYGNRFFSGFDHTNLSGGGCPDLGTFHIMPVSGELKVHPAYYATSYTDEIAETGYYKTTLPDYKITAEATATTRTAIERFSAKRLYTGILSGRVATCLRKCIYRIGILCC